MDEVKLNKCCECGCGEKVKEGNVYINHHNRRSSIPDYYAVKNRECACGCGQFFRCFKRKNTRFIRGHNSKGKNNSFYGKTHSKETIEKMRKNCNKGKKGKSYEEIYGNKKAKELKEERRQQMLGNQIQLGRKRPRQSILMKKIWSNEIYKEETLRKSREGANIKPNRLEKTGFNVIDKLFPNEYKLNVKGDVLILGGKIPDVVNINGQKKIIEFFGDYYHSDEFINRKGCYEDTEKGRKECFKQFGWNTLIIWEHELKNTNKVKQRIMDFHSL